MAEATDWDQLGEEYGSKFKPFIEDGKYKVKVADAEVHEVGTNGAVAIDIMFEEGKEFQYPKATHWQSEKNINWSKFHSKQLLVVLGVSEDAARKAIDTCEAKRGNKESLVKAYDQVFKKAAAKHAELEIEVYTERNENNGKDYARAEFMDNRVRMNRNTESKPATTTTSEVVPGAEEVGEEIDLADIPF